MQTGSLRRIGIAGGFLIAVFAAAGIFLAAHGMKRPVPVAVTPPAIPVVAGTVDQHDVPIYLRGVGTVIAYNTVILRSQIQGQIVSINFTEGQTVHVGDLLAQIDPRPYQAQIEQMTATRDRDEAQLKNAQANLTRNTHLGNQGRRGAHRRGEGAAQLYEFDLTHRWSGRHTTDRYRQHHSPHGPEWARGGYSDSADLADIHPSGDGLAANSGATAEEQVTAQDHRVQPGQYDQARRGRACPRQQRNPANHGFDPAQGKFCE